LSIIIETIGSKSSQIQVITIRIKRNSRNTVSICWYWTVARTLALMGCWIVCCVSRTPYAWLKA